MFLIIILLAPVWLPPIILITLFFSKNLKSQAFVWVYIAEFILTVSGISYLYSIRVPSGLAYLIVLFPAWLIMLIAMIMSIFSTRNKGHKP